MSRCICCNAVLSEKEMTTKNAQGEYEDMCHKCLTASDNDAHE